jgi:hypothetical protein
VAPALTDRPDAAAAADEGRPWSRSSKVQLLAIIAIGGFWVAIYAYTLLSGPHRPVGRMTDTTFATAAEPICAATAVDIEALGLPTAVDSAAERAELVLTENDLLRGMLDDLGRLDVPAGGEEGEWATEWLHDWAVHVEDRQRWADDLQAGDDHPFVETARQGEQISKGIDFFAETNRMPSCVTAGDV